MLDQLNAATREARQMLGTSALQLGVPVEGVRPGPVASGLLLEHAGQLLTENGRVCRHLRRSGLQPAWLLAWAPQRLRCGHCAYAVMRKVTGTIEDRTCDGCRAVDVDLTPIMGAAGPVIVVLGLCEPCTVLERAGARQ